MSIAFLIFDWKLGMLNQDHFLKWSQSDGLDSAIFLFSPKTRDIVGFEQKCVCGWGRPISEISKVTGVLPWKFIYFRFLRKSNEMNDRSSDSAEY